MRRPPLAPLLLLLPLAAVVLVAATAGTTRGPVDWREVRAVAIESDDWGLCGFVPDAAALADLDRAALDAGRFPAVYWASTLEDSAAVARLAAVLRGHRGADGLPPVFQPNYILSSLDLEPGPGGVDVWRRRDLPALPPAYARPGLWSAVATARRDGVWRPELHGAYHYDPELRRERATGSPAALAAARRGVVVFPGIARAWELGPWRPTTVLAAELEHSLAVFRDLFGRPPASVIAPDYVWDDRCEDLWEAHGLTVIQAKREQRRPWLDGPAAWRRIAKVLDRRATRLLHPGRTYLERNCRLETAQARDRDEVVAACLAEAAAAWGRGEPAVVESHRVNFVHTDPEVARAGREALDTLLEALEAGPPPLYLCDAEIAQLERDGTSAIVRGDRLVVRNLTHGTRLVRIPAGSRSGALLQLPPLTTRVITISQKGTNDRI